ncbi:hypothetical protein [Aestuariibacter sp. A3R04]|nr:hypothetical protein [Aestuariibacter sp. A3R04]MBU3022875.1 hypothetical protein [Aestuariibacter sp. A3R04]
MPLIPVIALAAGFAGGMFASDGVSKITNLVIVGGAAYLVYTKVIK